MDRTLGLLCFGLPYLGAVLASIPWLRIVCQKSWEQGILFSALLSLGICGSFWCGVLQFLIANGLMPSWFWGWLAVLVSPVLGVALAGGYVVVILLGLMALKRVDSFGGGLLTAVNVVYVLVTPIALTWVLVGWMSGRVLR